MNISQVGIGENLAGVGRHLAGRMPDVGGECREYDRSRSQPSPGRTTLALISVALVAAVLDEKALAVVGVGGKSERPQQQN